MFAAYSAIKFTEDLLKMLVCADNLRTLKTLFLHRSSEALDLGKYGITVNAYATG